MSNCHKTQIDIDDSCDKFKKMVLFTKSNHLNEMFVVQKRFFCHFILLAIVYSWQIVKQIKTINNCLRDHPMSRAVNIKGKF